MRDRPEAEPLSSTVAPQPEPTPDLENQAIELFFSYAPQDKELRDELAKHLGLLKRNKVIKDWHEGEISAGTEREPAIKQHLNSSQVILLLISSDFLSSDFCWKDELKPAMERHETGKARVIPVILRPVHWQDAPFGRLQALPRNLKPITLWSNQDEAFLDVINGICNVVKELQEREKLEEPVIDSPHLTKSKTEWDADTRSENFGQIPLSFGRVNPPRFVPRNEAAIEIWKEKLGLLREKQAIVTDASQKFELRKRIEECQQMIQELEDNV